MKVNGLSIRHQEDGFLIADKPTGLLSQPGRGPDLYDSVLTRIRSSYPWAELVHRLDRDTSGLLILALHPDIHRILSQAFADRHVEKKYIGLTEGRIEGSHGAISGALARISTQPPRYGIHSEGRSALTLWRKIAHEGDTTRIELTPVTGRSHQLRAHLQCLGHPLIGDPIYGRPFPEGVRLHLHAERLTFPHPVTGQSMRMEAPCPF